MTDFRIIEGDAASRLAEMEPKSAQTCVTSPPYWGLRDYGSDGQLGLEATPDEYVANLVAVFGEVKRVLRGDGTLWLNLGDSYASAWACDRRNVVGSGSMENGKRADRPNRLVGGLKEKDLVGIPWMVAFALRADGWYLRSDIIWHKPNPMPESVTDRPTKAHEYLFLLTKTPRYFYDADAIREAHSREWALESVGPGYMTAQDGRNDGGKRQGTEQNPARRNKRSVWTVATQPFPGAHFATFPPKLIEPCILAGSPPKCCGECGAAYERQVSERQYPAHLANAKKAHGGIGNNLGGQQHQNWLQANPRQQLGWHPTCTHDDDTGTPTVLDPFAGAGTTGVVSLRHNRSFVGIELNPDYAQMARHRIADDAPLLNVEAA